MGVMYKILGFMSWMVLLNVVSLVGMFSVFVSRISVFLCLMVMLVGNFINGIVMVGEIILCVVFVLIFIGVLCIWFFMI